MKILGISLFMFILLAGISLGIDFIKGYELPAIRSLNPLYVMELPELAIMYLLLLFLFIDPVLSFLQKKRNRK
ncbi:MULTISPECIES: hypothetical protein [Oceanobacillus]|uniref:Lycopene cyclase domain-containing protein n=1 Tax=Oceanobacillus aidingensis TaxID=645964 RepID=A0ABV9JWI7_9BACI|nr:hypothetical protein [Oceanobacillus oncorhynchi]MDM8100219.1 hypothetical protein [Oceanobacillus oncorhynchi]